MQQYGNILWYDFKLSWEKKTSHLKDHSVQEVLYIMV